MTLSRTQNAAFNSRKRLPGSGGLRVIGGSAPGVWSSARSAPVSTRRRILGELERPSDIFRHFGPNWFVPVMGTGIVGNAAVLLPVHVAALHTAAIGIWVLASLMLAAVSTATIAHWVRHPENARRHHHDPAMAPFYGTPPMAMMTVGTGALLVGRHIIGITPAVTADEVLWAAGTLTGLVAAIAVPYLMLTEFRLGPQDVSATWLLPVVPPIVSALAGAGLISRLPAGQDKPRPFLRAR